MKSVSIMQALLLLKRAEVVAIPTETVYGLAGNAYQVEALKKIFAIKSRPYSKPLVVQTNALARVATFVKRIPSAAYQLAKAFWPGGLTLLLEKKPCIPDLATANLSTVGVRIPNHPITLALLKELPFPLAVSSANVSGQPSPITAQQVVGVLRGKDRYILDAGSCPVGVESTIIGFVADKPVLHRVGCISIAAVEKVVGPIAKASALAKIR